MIILYTYVCDIYMFIIVHMFIYTYMGKHYLSVYHLYNLFFEDSNSNGIFYLQKSTVLVSDC